MATDVQRQRLMLRPHKTFATAGFLSTLLAVQMVGGCAMPQSTRERTNQPTLAPVLNENVPNKTPDQPKLAPVLNENSPNRIPDQYIVIFKPGAPRDVALAAQNRVKGLRGTIRTTYTSGLLGFSAELSENALQALRADPNVAYIEVNQMGQLNTSQPPTPPAPPPTGLARSSKRLLPLPTPLEYTYSETGNGVHIYVIDTGIRATHTEFGGSVSRVSGGMNVDTMTASDTGDCNSHGTEVAGIIGGATVGIAKEVPLHPVRANGTGTSGGGCGDTTLDRVIKAVDWVTTEVTAKRNNGNSYPAVVNLSSSFFLNVNSCPPYTGSCLSALVQAVTDSINSDIPYVIAAGNYSEPTNSPVNACNWSPASINMSNPNKAIVVGAIDPTTDTRWSETKSSGGVTYYVGSNVGPCLSLFAPGVGISTAFPINNTAIQPVPPGTSLAAAHVTGVVARILAAHPSYNPQQVWNTLHNANNVLGTTAGWGGVGNPGAGSPNELLHYGSFNDGYNDGDPHITTVNGFHYDFQNGGEFVALRDANGMEIQTRQTPVKQAEWVSVNTAIAARVGKHRVTWQPAISSTPDPSGLQLRMDGALTTIEANRLDLGDGGRIMKLDAGHTLEIHFPDGTALLVTAHWWEDRQQWYLNVRVFHSPATEGIMGVVEPDSWLQPQFAEKWRVTKATSLFDYAPGLSTETFTSPSFPKEKIPPITSENQALAENVCSVISYNTNMLKDCLFDVGTTTDPIFADHLLIDQKIQRGATTITLSDDRQRTGFGEGVTFTATVTRHEGGGEPPTGKVIFMLDGKAAGEPVTLDANGQARWKTGYKMVDIDHVAARYVPDKGSVFLPSSSPNKLPAVERRPRP